MDFTETHVGGVHHRQGWRRVSRQENQKTDLKIPRVIHQMWCLSGGYEQSVHVPFLLRTGVFVPVWLCLCILQNENVKEYKS